MEELWKVTERLIKWVKLLAVHYTGSPLRILVAGVRCKSLQDNNLKKAPVGLKIKNSHSYYTWFLLRILVAEVRFNVTG